MVFGYRGMVYQLSVTLLWRFPFMLLPQQDADRQPSTENRKLF